MKRRKLIYSKIVFILLCAVLATGCTYQKYIKTAQKYEQAGIYKQAVDNYLLSLQAKKKNNDKAKIGLIRTSKRYSDEIVLKLDDAYAALNDDKVIACFQSLKDLKNSVAEYGVEVEISTQTEGQYNETKVRFLKESYRKGQELIDKELFDEAAGIFATIIKIDKTYEKSHELYLFTLCEPLYRKAAINFQQKQFRSAYNNYEKIQNLDADYKDVTVLKKEALNEAVLTIAFFPVNNAYIFPYLTGQLNLKIQTEFQSHNNPFLRLVKPNFTEMMLEEQKKALLNNLPFDASSILPVRVNFNSTVNCSDYWLSKKKITEKKAFYKYKDQLNQINYKKVNYFEIQQSCQMSFTFRYEFIKTENSAQIASSIIERTISDEVNYAISDYPVSDLLPGNWGAGIKDTIYTDLLSKGLMNMMFAKRSQLKSRQELETSFAEIVAPEVYGKINAYNPEK